MNDTMTLKDALNTLCIEALMDDDKVILAKLPNITWISLGAVCPDCGGRNVETNCDGSEAQCADCENYYDTGERAVEAYEEVRDEYLARKARATRRGRR